MGESVGRWVEGGGWRDGWADGWTEGWTAWLGGAGGRMNALCQGYQYDPEVSGQTCVS